MAASNAAILESQGTRFLWCGIIRMIFHFLFSASYLAQAIDSSLVSLIFIRICLHTEAHSVWMQINCSQPVPPTLLIWVLPGGSIIPRFVCVIFQLANLCPHYRPTHCHVRNFRFASPWRYFQPCIPWSGEYHSSIERHRGPQDFTGASARRPARGRQWNKKFRLLCCRQRPQARSIS